MDALDLQNAAMTGTARYMEWKKKFLEEWQEAAAMGQMYAMFMALPAEVKDAMRQADPEKYDEMVSALKSKSKGVKHAY